MDRNQVIKTYLDLATKAQELEYYWENNTGTKEAFVDALDATHLYYSENNITRQELTDYNDRQRKVVKARNANEALSALNNFFSP